jgi:hypothetical protein
MAWWVILPQLYQLQELVEYLKRSSKKRWSGAELVEVLGYFFMEWSQICWSGVLPNNPLIRAPHHPIL